MRILTHYATIFSTRDARGILVKTKVCDQEFVSLDYLTPNPSPLFQSPLFVDSTLPLNSLPLNFDSSISNPPPFLPFLSPILLLHPMDIRETIKSHSDVALAITKRLLQHEANSSNVVLSPSSIHVVLSLIAAASKGPPLDQLLSFLKSNSTDNLNSFASQIVATVFADGSASGGPRLAFANGVWVDQSLSLKPSFKQVVDDVYKARLSQADFKTKVIDTLFFLGLFDLCVDLISCSLLEFKGN